ncbi:hypothetical protein CK203_033693 [Vitis vinifera]|uniref:Uncharacterized protein n=1 Tax=Vitis vinifera TaxID=29760 RepID=A0A438HSA7_VITVI|nr:hypothetical protein CK203_033693 [Vitis vinifera]
MEFPSDKNVSCFLYAHLCLGLCNNIETCAKLNLVLVGKALLILAHNSANHISLYIHIVDFQFPF